MGVKVENSKELNLEYPCNWEYKVILDKEHNIDDLTKESLPQRDYTIKKSKNSKNGKYNSYSVNVLVHNHDDRKMIFETLKKHNKTKFVL